MPGSGPEALATDLGVAPDAAARLARYLDLLEAWSARVNLTGARTRAERIDLLLRPVVALAGHVRPGRLLDLGSGNGSPGLVLAALCPEAAVTLLEPRQKRWAFLREAGRTMGVGVEVRRERHDQYPGPPADTLTVRALALPAGDLAALLAPEGRLLVLGTAPAPHPALEPEPPPAPGVHSYRRR